MKKITLFIFVAFLASCQTDNSVSLLQTQVTNTVQSGNWKITLFQDDATVETSNYTGYVFNFATNNVATAVKNSVTTTGTWQTGTDDSKVKLILNFGTSSPLDELAEDWRVLERTDTKIVLEHVSGGNGGTDKLTFEKT
jgi:hypothetical protein